ncbi:MAG: hypothetical protein ACYSW6_11730 [Planctomycetota bacterium]|jgi:hypothetical protein
MDSSNSNIKPPYDEEAEKKKFLHRYGCEPEIVQEKEEGYRMLFLGPVPEGGGK